MRRLPRALLTLLAVLTLCACGDKAQDGSNGEDAAVAWDALSFDKTMPLDYAAQFSVSYAGDDYKLWTLAKGQQLAMPVADPATGEILFDEGHVLTGAECRELDAIGVAEVSVKLDSGDVIRVFTNRMCDMSRYVDFAWRVLWRCCRWSGAPSGPARRGWGDPCRCPCPPPPPRCRSSGPAPTSPSCGGSC